MRTFAPEPKRAQRTTSARPAMPGRAHLGQSREAISILHVRRAIGNQAVQGLLQNTADELPPSVGAIQAKLAINTPGDEHELEADRVAERVMRMPAPSVQRMWTEDEAEDRIGTETIGRVGAATPSPDSVRRQAAECSSPIDAPQAVSDVVSESGRPLDPLVRSFMEPRFGHDFSHVRIHTGGRAAESARAVNAVAYTVGRDVVFGEGAYSPEADAGRRLIAHELTHVIQQRGADTGVEPESENEFGDSTALTADRGVQPYTRSPRRVQRQEACYCCASSVAIQNITPIDTATHMGHSFDFVINMARATEHGPRLEPECTLEWWEKTNVPAIPGHAPNTWTNMFQLLPRSRTFNPWNNRPTACDTNSTVTITDPPRLGKRPGRTVTRTLEFDLRVKSGPGATCASREQSATARQVLTMVNGAPDWANSSFT